MSIEAMKAIQMVYANTTKHDWPDDIWDAICQAIKAEKHEVSQEPVAWIEHEWSGSGLRHLHFERREQSLRDEVVNPIWTPLYINPQPKREWVGLPHEEIDYQAKKDDHGVYFALGALWAEARLKEKNT